MSSVFVQPKPHSHGTERIFHRMKILTVQFVHAEEFSIKFRSVHTERMNQVEFKPSAHAQSATSTIQNAVSQLSYHTSMQQHLCRTKI